jgi:hypothetical protein
MSILSEILSEEYERLNSTLSSYEAMAADLPKGSIREKLINGRAYLYLQWREGDRVRSKYVKLEDFVALSEQIERRREYEREIKSLRKSKRKFDRVVGKEL